MVDNGRTRFVVITGNKPPTVVPNDNFRRPSAPGSGGYRLVRRGSLDNATILRARPLVLTRGNTFYDQRDRRLSYMHTTGREAGLRKQATTPRATTVTPVKELKSILKSTKTSSPAASSANKSQSGTQTSHQSAAESKCSYRLPENPDLKLRKSVSFREDQLGSVRKPRQQLASPAISFWIKGLEKPQEFYV